MELLIKEKSAGRQHATVQVKTSGSIHHRRKEVHAKFMRKEYRKEYALEAEKFGPFEAFHKRLADPSDLQYQAGNLSKCVNPAVVRKIQSDHHLCQRTDREIFFGDMACR